MKKSVDHNARKREIITQSIRLFAEVGYKDVSFREISERCGVARTVLYRYFRNKRQIFDTAIVFLMDTIVQRHKAIVHSKQPVAVRLREICTMVTALMFDNREFLGVTLDFIIALKRGGFDPTRRILKFTIGLKRIVHTLLVVGIHKGEFRADVNPELYTDIIYGLLESLVLRLTVSGDAALADMLARINEVLKGLEKK